MEPKEKRITVQILLKQNVYVECSVVSMSVLPSTLLTILTAGILSYHNR